MRLNRIHTKQWHSGPRCWGLLESQHLNSGMKSVVKVATTKKKVQREGIMDRQCKLMFGPGPDSIYNAGSVGMRISHQDDFCSCLSETRHNSVWTRAQLAQVETQTSFGVFLRARMLWIDHFRPSTRLLDVKRRQLDSALLTFHCFAPCIRGSHNSRTRCSNMMAILVRIRTQPMNSSSAELHPNLMKPSRTSWKVELHFDIQMTKTISTLRIHQWCHQAPVYKLNPSLALPPTDRLPSVFSQEVCGQWECWCTSSWDSPQKGFRGKFTLRHSAK